MPPITLFGHTLGQGPVEGALDHVAGSTDEAVGRQFDSTVGGGGVDEIAAVLDPTRRASEQTEQDLGTYFEFQTAAIQPGIAVLGGAGQGDVTDPFGNLDETLGRQFDTEPGGGFVDEGGRVAQETADAAANAAGDVAGALGGAIPWTTILLVVGAFVFLYSASDQVVTEAAR